MLIAIYRSSSRQDRCGSPILHLKQPRPLRILTERACPSLCLPTGGAFLGEWKVCLPLRHPVSLDLSPYAVWKRNPALQTCTTRCWSLGPTSWMDWGSTSSLCWFISPHRQSWEEALGWSLIPPSTPVTWRCMLTRTAGKLDSEKSRLTYHLPVLLTLPIPLCRGGVLEPEGTVEIKFRRKDLVKTMRRVDPIYTSLAERLGEVCSCDFTLFNSPF